LHEPFCHDINFAVPNFACAHNYKNLLNSEDVMKKVFSVLALVMMVVSLTGCMDSPDIGNKKPANYGAGPAQGKAN
jgi:hypothetical protein